MKASATALLELGRGLALSRMVAGLGSDTRCLEQLRTLQGARVWLREEAPGASTV